MIGASEYDAKAMDMVRSFDLGSIRDHYELVEPAHQLEIENLTGRPNLYYQWLHCLTKIIQPKQVIELGAAAGMSTIMIATALPKSSKFYSVDIDPQSWRWMKYDYPQLTRILSDDLEMSIWDGIDTLDTDLWFIDSLHTEEQLRKEVEAYSPMWKRGAVVVFDDISINEGMRKVWDELEYDKFENPLLHWGGFGLCVV